MEIKAQIVGDSKNEFGDRITTFVITYPRIIHSEFMTHRMFSRNAASSRAVPSRKLIDAVVNHPFIPLAFQKQHSGMQGREYITDPIEIAFEVADWLDDRDYAVKKAKARLERKITKQIINRPLETFQYYTTIVTATEWENFFALRCPRYQALLISEDQTYRSKKDWLEAYPHLKETAPKDYLSWANMNTGQAEIHMMALAEAMWDAYNESTPKQLKAGEWHIPFNDKIIFHSNDLLNLGLLPPEGESIDSTMINDARVKIATVMAARTSYTVVGEDQKPMTYKRMIEMHDEMVVEDPKHMSPFEHCAPAMNAEQYNSDAYYELGGNFKGFIQYRKMIHGENITS